MILSIDAQALEQAKAATNLSVAVEGEGGLGPAWEIAYELWRRVPKWLRDRYAI